MNKKTKNIIIAIAVIVGVFLLIFIGLMVKRNLSVQAVNVYPVSMVSTVDYEENVSSSSGNVRSEGFQNLHLSETQTVKEIFVSEGQEIKAGDAILSYDTTLSDLDIEKADIEVQKLNLNINKAYEELNELYSLEPAYEIYYEPDNSGIEYNPQKTPFFISGKGTKEDPMYWLIDDTNSFNAEFFNKVLPKKAKDLYIVFVKKEMNALNAQLEFSFGLHIIPSGDSYSFNIFQGDVPEDIAEYEAPEEPWVEEGGSPYTEAEIAEMIAEKQAAIREMEAQLQVSSLQLQKLQKEIARDTEVAKEDGIVQTVRDPAQAFKEGTPVVEISSGGGFYIDVFLNELELSNVHEGDTVSVSTYNSMKTCEGTIKKISILPSQNADNWSNGNTNVSYYPFTVFVPGEEGLEEGEYANITYDAAGEDDGSFYLSNMFIRKDGNGSYVYIKGTDEKLERRDIQTGKSLWGSYTQIKNGLTQEDLVAFPYGKDIKIGAATTEADLDTLYSY